LNVCSVAHFLFQCILEKKNTSKKENPSLKRMAAPHPTWAQYNKEHRALLLFPTTFPNEVGVPIDTPLSSMALVPTNFAWEHVSAICAILTSVFDVTAATVDTLWEDAGKVRDAVNVYAEKHGLSLSDVHTIFGSPAAQRGNNLGPHNVVYFLRDSGDLVEARGFIVCNYPPKCAVCKKATTKKCSVCKTTYYCSKQCQSADWDTHRATHEAKDA